MEFFALAIAIILFVAVGRYISTQKGRDPVEGDEDVKVRVRKVERQERRAVARLQDGGDDAPHAFARSGGGGAVEDREDEVGGGHAGARCKRRSDGPTLVSRRPTPE